MHFSLKLLSLSIEVCDFRHSLTWREHTYRFQSATTRGLKHLKCISNVLWLNGQWFFSFIIWIHKLGQNYNNGEVTLLHLFGASPEKNEYFTVINSNTDRNHTLLPCIEPAFMNAQWHNVKDLSCDEYFKHILHICNILYMKTSLNVTFTVYMRVCVRVCVSLSNEVAPMLNNRYHRGEIFMKMLHSKIGEPASDLAWNGWLDEEEGGWERTGIEGGGGRMRVAGSKGGDRWNWWGSWESDDRKMKLEGSGMGEGSDKLDECLYPTGTQSLDFVFLLDTNQQQQKPTTYPTVP